MKKYLLASFTWLQKYSTEFVWILSTGAVLGSLYFSEIRHFPPCELCWYARILMYPIAFITSVALIKKPRPYWRGYVLALSIPGIALAFFHSLLQWGIISEEATSCSIGNAVSCSDPEINYFGFITIPFLGLITFLAITVIAILSDPKGKIFTWLKSKLS